jgi:transposase
MPTPRQFGQEVARNARRGPNISPTERQRIIAKRQCGETVRELAAEFRRSESAIKYIIRTYTKTGTTQEQPRSGRPPVLSLHQKKSYTERPALHQRLSTQSSSKLGLLSQWMAPL